ncbi:hypothetical protein SAMN04487846_0073 [Microbacterium sp. cf046]|uniref:hypothetical protein n=1 Tax=Microbacterium sp. cf046 TaxID=1761803 RepID=UPI0008EA080F|nr:hypothetical protein [Microbacterium sp. cf046]SFR86459.1 hypothetical protein SAMN04487846_0073 [Microbacterium sp. cf046]
MSSPYYLAIDVRGDITAAAAAEGSRSDAIRTQPILLGSGSAMPTAVYVAPDRLFFGEEAIARGDAEPSRLIRDFVPGVGDPAAVQTIDGERFAAADLYAWTVDNVAQRVASSRGAQPAGIWAVIPAWWVETQVDAVAEAFDRDGRTAVELITAPEALASRYARTDPSNPDLTLVVCDVDDHALQAAFVRQMPGTRSRQISPPIHSPISPSGAQDDAVDARAVDSVALALSAAGVEIDMIDAIVLSGASDRLGDFSRLLAARFGDPIETDPHPGWATAAGAALALGREEIAQLPAAPVVAAPPVRVAAPAWYRRPAWLAAIGVGAAALVSGAAVAGAFAIGSVAPSGGETDPPAADLSSTAERASSGTSTPTPSVTPQPTPDAVPPPTAADPIAPDSPTEPVSREAPDSATPSTPVLAPAPTNPSPTAAPPASTPAPTLTPDPTPSPAPEPTMEPSPTPEPTPEPEPTVPAPSPTPPDEPGGRAP